MKVKLRKCLVLLFIMVFLLSGLSAFAYTKRDEYDKRALDALNEDKVLHFSDVPEGHWAESAVHSLRRLSITEGIGNNRFGLGLTIKRSEFITYLVRLMQWDLISPKKGSYSDNVDSNKWYYPYIETALCHNVLVSEGNLIRPDDPITREEMAVMIVNTLGYDTLAGQLTFLGSPFNDVTANTGYITIAKDFEIINGVGNGKFNPNATAKREEAAAMMVRMNDRLNKPMDEHHAFYAISSFNQIDKIDSLDSVSFGWSRLEYDHENDTVKLNTTSSNKNEYAIPNGFSAPIERAKNNGISTQLMITVKNEIINNSDSGKGVPLIEYIISEPECRKQVISSIVGQINDTGASSGSASLPFDGVVIDFEELKENQKQNLISFLAGLKSELNKTSKKLYVAVHPKRKQGQVYFDGYDYKTIGEIADKVILMAHDYYAKRLTDQEMQNGYTVTPLTPFDEVYYALKAITDSESGIQDRSKIWLQISFDSALWMLRDGKIINRTPVSPNYETIRNRLVSGVTLNYSTLNQNPNARYYDSTDDTENVLWYEDSQSVQAKITLAKMFGLSGLSIWRLGNIPDYTGQTDINGEEINLDVWQQILSNFEK